MENKKIIFIGLYLVSVFISSISQILLKIAAERTYSSKMREYLNPLVIIAYGMFFGTSIFVILALRYIALSTGAILETMGYIFVAVLSYFILKEKLCRKKLLGMSAIILGIIIYSL